MTACGRVLRLTRDGALVGPGDGAPVLLTESHRRILTVLSERPGVVLSAGRILDAVHAGRPERPREETVGVQVCYLRKRLAKAGCADAVVTVWGQGFYFDGARYVLDLPAAAPLRLTLPPRDLDRLEAYAGQRRATLSEAVAELLSDALSALDGDSGW